MVFNYDGSFPGNLFYQVNLSSQSVSYVETPSFQIIPEKQDIISVEARNSAHSLEEDSPPCEAVSELSVSTEHYHYENHHESHQNLSRFEHMFDAVYEKRSHPGDILEEQSSKRAKTTDLTNQIHGISFEFSPVKNPHAEPLPSEFNFDHYPRKHVVLGPNHQASIPQWRPRPNNKPTDEETREQRLMGTPITSSSSSASSSSSFDQIACRCDDPGSINCVRWHVAEARERMKSVIGEAQFADLGLLDMGEAVASRWAEEDEQIFREVVAENPASSGKNFWGQLGKFLPSKSSKELVSYYFNVFVLRRRAEQNRSEPLIIDSDDDEWQCVEEEDSGVISDRDDRVDDDVNVCHSSAPQNFLLRDESCMSFEGEGHVAGRDDGFLLGLQTGVDFLPTCHVIKEVFGEGVWAAADEADSGEAII